MSVSVIIPAHNEERWLNRTIQNIFSTTKGEIEVVVVLNGNWHPVDPRAKVIRNKDNEGERVAMNQAAEIARGTHILRIDAHCDFSPTGWDVMMEEVTGPKDITQAVLTAVDKSWKRLPGHRYERCRLLPNYEAKWEKPNRDMNKKPYAHTIPNMSSTGCGFMIRKDFYHEIGGADESYPTMGAIGEEFSVKTWMNGGKVQTRTDVTIGHIFDTGGYDTGGVVEARRRLVETFGDRYGEIRERFPDLDWSDELRPTAKQSNVTRETVTVKRTDTDIYRDATGVIVGQEVRVYVYLWVAASHPEEIEWSDDQIRLKYAKEANVLYSRETLVANADGKLVDQNLIIEPESRQLLDNSLTGE